MMKHTPGPWKVGEYDEHLGYDCMTGGVRAGPVVLDLHDYGQVWRKEPPPGAIDRMMADAHRIVDCVNAHDTLVANLDELAAALRGVIAVADRNTDEFNRARAALAKLED